MKTNRELYNITKRPLYGTLLNFFAVFVYFILSFAALMNGFVLLAAVLNMFMKLHIFLGVLSVVLELNDKNNAKKELDRRKEYA